MATLRLQDSSRVRQAAIDHAIVGVVKSRAVVGSGSHLSALGRAAFAQILRTKRRVKPGSRRPIKRVAKDKSFAIAVADVGKEKARFPHALARGSGGVGYPNQGHSKQTEVSVDQSNVFVEPNSRTPRKELPFRMLRVANSDPCLPHDVNVTRELVHVARFEVQGVLGGENHGIWLARNLDVPVNLVEFARSCAQVVLRLAGLNMLGVIVEDDVACSSGFVVFVVVFDVIGAERDLSVLNQNILISDEKVALLFLRAVRRNFYDFALSGGQTNELCANRGRRGEPKK